MDNDFEIFSGKKYSDLCKDVYKNSTHKQKQIDILIDELRKLIKSTNDALLIVPLIKEYLDVAVKNDEHLVKLAAIVQKIVKTNNNDSGGFMLTEEERNQLLSEVESTVKDMNYDDKKLKNLKNKLPDSLKETVTEE
jgi:hypothetical protein